MTDWRARAEADLGFAKEMLMKHGEIAPMFVMYCEDDKIRIIEANWASREQKHVARKMITLMGVALGARAIVFIAEAWERRIAKLDDESESQHLARAREAAEKGLVEEAPETDEILLVNVLWREGGERHNHVRSARIVRDAEGAVTGTVDHETDETFLKTVAGDMLNLLCPYEPNETMRANARLLMEEAKAFGGVKVREEEIDRGN